MDRRERALAPLPSPLPTQIRDARREGEVLNLHWRDLDLEGGFYRYTGKGGKERQRALPPPVRLAILVYAEAAGLARRPEE